MATSGTPYSGLNQIGAWVYQANDMILVAYSNTANSLGDATVFADLSLITTANGYAPITLSKANWVVTNGICTYTGNTQWSATGVWSATMVGYAIVYGTTLMHFKDALAPFVASAGGKFTADLVNVVA